MPANEIKIVLSAIDHASAAMKKVGGSATDMRSALTAVGAVAGIATTAFVAFQQVIDKTVTPTVAYNKSIREMTQVTGLGAEEMSRIVQVGDDWGISIEQLRTSLGMMNKNGVKPSIDNLAKLADEYVATADKTAFAEKASKLLGRQYQTLIPLFAKGGQALRDQAAAIDENLLATDKSIQAAREYEVALDNWNDSVLGLKMSIGNQLLPELTNMIDDVNNLDQGTRRYVATSSDAAAKIRKMAMDTEAFSSAASKARFAADDLIKGIDETASAASGAADAISDVVLQLQALSTAQLASEAVAALNKAYKDGTITEEDYKEAMKGVGKELLGLTTAEINAQLALFEMKQALEAGSTSAVEFTDYAKSLDRTLRGIPHDIPVNMDPSDIVNATTKAAALKKMLDNIPRLIKIQVKMYESKIYEDNKASGGPVEAGKLYTVGEQGPEAFVPWTNGTIIPNNRMPSAGGGGSGATQGNGGGSGTVSLYIAKQTINVGSGDPDEVQDAVSAGILRAGASIGYSG